MNGGEIDSKLNGKQGKQANRLEKERKYKNSFEYQFEYQTAVSSVRLKWIRERNYVLEMVSSKGWQSPRNG